jgi:hypothetical protein
MGLQKIERVRKFLAFEYDATVDGGTAGTYTMRNLDPLSALEAGLVILDCFAQVKTARTGAGAIDIGDGTTADKWFDTTVIAAASANAIVAPQTAAKLTLTETGKLSPVVTIGVGGVTAYKIIAYFEYVKPL